MSLETQLSLHHDLKDKRKNTTQAVNIKLFLLEHHFLSTRENGYHFMSVVPAILNGIIINCNHFNNAILTLNPSTY